MIRRQIRRNFRVLFLFLTASISSFFFLLLPNKQRSNASTVVISVQRAVPTTTTTTTIAHSSSLSCTATLSPHCSPISKVKRNSFSRFIIRSDLSQIFWKRGTNYSSEYLSLVFFRPFDHETCRPFPSVLSSHLFKPPQSCSCLSTLPRSSWMESTIHGAV